MSSNDNLCGHTDKCNQPYDEPWNNNCCPGCRVLCLNHEFCGGSTCTQLLEIHHELCKSCEISYHFGMKVERLTIFDTNEKCVGCNKLVKRKMMFPDGCGHSFCLPCSQNILLEKDEDDERVSPELFRCPPCPNGCKNPDQGPRCDCEEYDEVKKKWEMENPVLYELYNKLERYLDENTEFKSYECIICHPTTCHKKRKQFNK
jgi:hypothetical protein